MGDLPAHAPGATAEIVSAVEAETRTVVRGTVRVSPTVLIELIELTVRDVAGVVELRSHPRRGRSARSYHCSSPTSRTFDDGKVRVGIDGDKIDADIRVSVERGTNITALSHEIQRRIGLVAGQMLGMTVTTVNIYVDDIVGRDSTEES